LWAGDGNGDNMRNCDSNKVAGVEESGGGGNNEGNCESSKSNGDGIREGR
jgi:hypothetical protein